MKELARIATLLAAMVLAAVGTTNAVAEEGTQVSLDRSFDPDEESYSATVANDVTEITVKAAASHPSARVTVNGGDPDTPVALEEGENTIVVEVTAEDERYRRRYTVVVIREGTSQRGPEPEAVPLAASFEGVPSEHDGKGNFSLLMRLSETVGNFAKSPRRSSFAVRGGRVRSVEQAEAGLWRVKVKPDSWRDVTVTLAGGRDCDAPGSVCTPDGRALSNTASATVGGPARIVTKRSSAREGKDDAVVFKIRLSRAASAPVTVDWATADAARAWKGARPATAGADYTAASGTIAFAAGESEKTVSVPVLDDAVDERTEHFLLRFSNPQGAFLRGMHREAVGLIVNDDHLQSAWLARFGRTVAGHVADAVSDRLEGGLAPGVHATLAGRPVAVAEGGRALPDALTALALAYGAREAEGEGPITRDGPDGLSADEVAAVLDGRSLSARDVLLGSAFHVAPEGGHGPAAWGRVAHGGFEGVELDGTGRTVIDGKVTTLTLGADVTRGRVLAGLAVSLSEGEGAFEAPEADTGGSGTIGSDMTTIGPYARLEVTERIMAWGLAGRGTGGMTLAFDDGSDPVRAGLSMRMAALGARGELLRQDASGGMDLALKADALFVETSSEAAANSAATRTDARRLRLLLEGARSFAVSETVTFRPSVEIGLRHDGGDAETGTGVEAGFGVEWSDAATGLSADIRLRTLLAHADSDYGEWGASASIRLDPGERGRGRWFSLTSDVGAAGAAERLWAARDAPGLVPEDGGSGDRRSLRAEAGYGMPVLGGRFTGTPNAGVGLDGDGAREARVGWRLTPAAKDAPDFEIGIDAARRETGEGAPAGTLMLKGTIRW